MESLRTLSVRELAPPIDDSPRLTRAAANALDAEMVRLGLPVMVLMENAARAIAEVALHLLGTSRRSGIVVVCGGGNNGADGLAAARLLSIRGQPITLVSESPREDLGTDPSPWSVHARLAARMGIPRVRDLAELPREVRSPNLIIDALLGTGARGCLRPASAEAIRTINTLRARTPGCRTLAVDVPSGLDADTGESLGETVHADATVTFGAIKEGLARTSLPIGDVYLADLGLPQAFIAPFTTPGDR